MNFGEYVKDNVLLMKKSNINVSELVAFLRDNRPVTKLILERCNIDNKEAKEFAELTSISSLELHDTRASVEAIKALAKLKNLTELNLVGEWKIDDPVALAGLIAGIIAPSIFLPILLISMIYAIQGPALIVCCTLACTTALLVFVASFRMLLVACEMEYSKYARALADGNFENLTSLSLCSNGISDKSIEALVNGNFPNLTSLNLSNSKISDKSIEALVNGNFPNLTSLNLSNSKISDKSIEALVNGNFPSLTSLNLGYNKISDKVIEALAKSHYLKSRACGMDCNYRGDKSDIHKFLIRLYSQNKSIGNFNPDSIKKAVFSTARQDYGGEAIKYALEKPDKYPFLINSKDEQGHTLFHFYNHSPEVQQFLFERGLIPEKERNQRREDERIARDSQSVHASPIVKRINFFTKKLVESVKVDKEQLKQAAASYVKSIRLFKQYQNDSIKLRLLSLTDNEKGSVMEKTLRETDPIPGDEEFIKTIIDKAEQALEQQYLRKNSDGKYDEGYPTNRMQYNYARDDAKITIPESIGYIKLLIDNFSVPLKEKKELLVTLMEQNPDLVKNKLSKVKEKLGNNVILDKEQFNKAELHGLLNGIDDGKKVDELFKEISCLNIEEVWREQKEFVLLKQIYTAATTYGENSSACTQGTWTQIISSIEEISSEIVKQYGCYLEEEQKLEAQKDVITEENITPFVENLAKKLIQYVEDNPESKEVLQNHLLYLEHIDVDDPEKVTFEQQKILAKINQEFTANITKFLVNYGRSIPKEDEYKIIIKELFETEIMKDFALEKDDQPQILTQSQSVYSKISIGCGVVIGIAGVATGIAIAVYLEMLAVGIAVGACCLVAAAIIYCCSGPSNSLEKSSAEAVAATIGTPLKPR